MYLSGMESILEISLRKVIYVSVACFIPIKANSERVPGKNFRVLNGKKLYQYICESIKAADSFDKVYVDTNSDEIAVYAKSMGFEVIIRKPELALNTANGNDLLVYHYLTHSEYDFYFQVFATAPYLKAETIKKCVNKLIYSEKYDSCFTALEKHGFYWFEGHPINYRPDILPRSQDLPPVIEETTGLYGISKDSLEKYRCRIGKNPYIYCVSQYEAVDINTEEDFSYAEHVGRLLGDDFL